MAVPSLNRILDKHGRCIYTTIGHTDYRTGHRTGTRLVHGQHTITMISFSISNLGSGSQVYLSTDC